MKIQIGDCRICGAEHHLHRDGDAFVVEPTGVLGTAEALQPRPATNSIEAFISQAPDWVDI